MTVPESLAPLILMWSSRFCTGTVTLGEWFGELSKLSFLEYLSNASLTQKMPACMSSQWGEVWALRTHSQHSVHCRSLPSCPCWGHSHELPFSYEESQSSCHCDVGGVSLSILSLSVGVQVPSESQAPSIL